MENKGSERGNNSYLVSGSNGAENSMDQLVVELRDLIARDEQLRVLDFEDQLLVKFLRSRLYNVERTLATLKLYVSTRTGSPELFQMPHDIKVVFDNDAIGILPDKHPTTGETILYTRSGRWDPSKFSFDVMSAGTVITLDAASFDTDTQIKGIIDIVDMKDFGWKQMKSFGPFQAKLTGDLTDKILPIRLNEIHVINESYLAKMAYSLMRPFLSEEYAKKIHFHGSDLTQLYKVVPREVLPKELGGSKGAFSCKLWYEELLGHESALRGQWYACHRQ